MDMSALERHAHWQNVYQIKGERDVSWFEETPAISLDLIHATGVGVDAPIIDIGGGTSRLVDTLVAEGFRSVTVLDISEKALATSRDRLGNHARANVRYGENRTLRSEKRKTALRPLLQTSMRRTSLGDRSCLSLSHQISAS
jgi:2-polyprenyl-3-methyl-5-hydroxy-6-metoxy-1,4-benzoquinol methylase